MSFLYTIFLPALAAAAIPFLLHFFSRQRLPVVDFSSLEFLRKLQKNQARRVRLRQIILLILRTLALLALVAAFARPALKSQAAGSSASSTEMVIVLDDALTSAAETRNGTIYRQEIDYLRSLLELAGSNDRVTILFSSRPTVRSMSGSTEANIALKELEDRLPAPYKSDLSGCITVADSILGKSDLFNRELFILSSFYGVRHDTFSVPSFDKTRTYLIPVGPDDLPNAGIEKVKLISAIRQKGRPIELAATVRNYGKTAVEGLPISLFVGDERVAQGSVDIPGDGVSVKNFVFTLPESGLLSGTVRLEDPDPLPQDNRRFFVLDVPERLRLFIVASDSLEFSILKSVFESGPESYYDLTLRLARQWETEPLTGYDGILLSGIPTISPGAVQRIVEFAENGGGVLLMPGQSSDLADWSRGVLKDLGYKAVTGVTTGGIKWGKFDRSHPLFFGIFEETGSPAAPNLSFAITLTIGAGDLSIIPLSSGAPFLLERQVGRGRALLFASPPSPAAGEFIFSGIFAPMLFRSVAYAASGRYAVEDSWETGSRQAPVLQLPDAISVTIVTPSGDVFSRQPRSVMGGVEYDAGRIESPGIYRFEQNGEVVAKFPANIAEGLGSLNRSNLKEISGKFKNAVVLDIPREQISAEVTAARYGRELWRPIAAAFLGLLIAESIVGRIWKKEEV